MTTAAKFLGISKQFEFLIKVGTVLLGGLYVLGLLITNIQLMTLGIADFSSLRTRNIMIGFVFLLYVLLLCLMVLPVSITLNICFGIIKEPNRSISRKLLAIVGRVIFCLIILLVTISLTGTLMGYLYPAGRQWLSPFSSDIWSWKYLTADVFRTLHQTKELYWRPKAIVAIMVVTLYAAGPAGAMYLAVKDSLKKRLSQEDAPQAAGGRSVTEDIFPELRALNRWIAWAMLAGALPLLLFDYADAVYPNLLYNLGGGQPRIARLNVEKKDASTYSLFHLSPSSNDKEQVVQTNPVIIWYQDERFIYISTLTEPIPPQTKVIAIDSKAVFAIAYLQGYARIGSGGQIVSVFYPSPG